MSHLDCCLLNVVLVNLRMLIYHPNQALHQRDFQQLKVQMMVTYILDGLMSDNEELTVADKEDGQLILLLLNMQGMTLVLHVNQIHTYVEAAIYMDEQEYWNITQIPISQQQRINHTCNHAYNILSINTPTQIPISNLSTVTVLNHTAYFHSLKNSYIKSLNRIESYSKLSLESLSILSAWVTTECMVLYSLEIGQEFG